jgi:hypothetical protein
MTISVEDFTDREESYHDRELLRIEVAENAWRKCGRRGREDLSLGVY